MSEMAAVHRLIIYIIIIFNVLHLKTKIFNSGVIISKEEKVMEVLSIKKLKYVRNF